MIYTIITNVHGYNFDDLDGKFWRIEADTPEKAVNFVVSECCKIAALRGYIAFRSYRYPHVVIWRMYQHGVWRAYNSGTFFENSPLQADIYGFDVIKTEQSPGLLIR